MTYEELRIQCNRAYWEYASEPIGPEKMRLLGIWKNLCLQRDDAFLADIKGETPKDSSRIGMPDRSLADPEELLRMEIDGHIYAIICRREAQQRLDLTKMYGAGNEPELEDLRKMFPPESYEYPEQKPPKGISTWRLFGRSNRRRK